MKNKFILTEQHLLLLKRMYVTWEDSMAWAPCINPKRPYGNSDVEGDIAHILGMELFEDADGEKHLSKEQFNTIQKLHSETEIALQICLCNQKFEVGTYVKKDQYDDRSWEKAK